MIDNEKLLKDFVENLYFRAAQCKYTARDEYMAIKGVQHALEDALLKQGITTQFRPERDNIATRRGTNPPE